MPKAFLLARRDGVRKRDCSSPGNDRNIFALSGNKEPLRKHAHAINRNILAVKMKISLKKIISFIYLVITLIVGKR